MCSLRGPQCSLVRVCQKKETFSTAGAYLTVGEGNGVLACLANSRARTSTVGGATTGVGPICVSGELTFSFPHPLPAPCIMIRLHNYSCLSVLDGTIFISRS